ncbi:unnamed protein product [Miscanthus lutarioriparius]|uniref:Uncharacterized protein n=1 Tax=Miscanthus lutarioriparius TaxID=422564 RepID=A0A811PTM3_9POAL|nr:unnamed protein product [Miscanthus lutarioriparius]
MAQGKMPEAGTGAPREAMPSAYGGIEADRLVVLAKPLPTGAGHCAPFAVVRFQDLPEELHRQIADAHGAAAPVAAPLRGEGVDARYHAALPVDVVVPDEGLRRQLPGLFSGPDDSPAVKFAGDGNSDAVNEYSERRILRLMEEDGKVVVYLDASALQVLGDMEGSLFQKEKGFSHAWMGHSGDNGLPAREDAAPVVVALLLDNNHIAGTPALELDSCSDGVASPREDAVPFVQTLVGNDRATEQDVYGVLLPPDNVVVPAVEALRASRPPAYAVQVSVDGDAAVGGKAGDPIAGGVKAAGAGAGNERGGNLSAVLGIVVASSAATALAAGTLGPAAAFGLFAALVGGLSLAMASVRDR